MSFLHIGRFVTLAVTVLVLFSATGDARAIVIRHDRDDARYRQLGEGYPELVSIGLAHGVLIAPDWVLTAAHVVDGLSPIGYAIDVAGQSVPIRRVVLHPDWIGDLGPGLADPEWIDLALVQLSRPIAGISPAVPYGGTGELGKTVTLVGDGRTGTGRTGTVEEDDRVRAATNVVDRVNERALYLDFETPPAGTELEGISGKGDSGGPAFLVIDGTRYVVGISSWNQHVDRGLAECVYGTTEVYTRVSTRLPWIREVMAQQDGRGTVRELDAEGWPTTLASRMAQEFFEAFARDDDAALLRFSRKLLQEPRSLQTPEEWAALWNRQRRSYGRTVPTHFVDLNEHKIVVLARSRDQSRSFRFELQGTDPAQLRELIVRRESATGGVPQPKPGAAAAVPPERLPEFPPFTETEQNRYNAIARTLVESINRGDRETYRGLFTDAGWEQSIDWWHDMFAAQTARFGKIAKAWAPQRGIVRAGKLGAGNDWGGAALMVHFEEPVGGVLTIHLDDSGKIARTDVFIQRGLGAQEPEGIELIYRLGENSPDADSR